MASAGSQGSYGWKLAVYELVYKSNFLDELLHDTPATVQGNNPAVLYKVERQHVWFFFYFYRDERKYNDGDSIWHLWTFFFFNRLGSLFLFEASPFRSYRFTPSHLGAAAGHSASGGEPGGEPEGALFPPLLFTSPSLLSPCECSVMLGVRQPAGFDLVQPSRCLWCRAIYRERLWSSNCFAKPELCLTPRVRLTEAWHCARLSANCFLQQITFNTNWKAQGIHQMFKPKWQDKATLKCSVLDVCFFVWSRKTGSQLWLPRSGQEIFQFQHVLTSNSSNTAAWSAVTR